MKRQTPNILGPNDPIREEAKERFYSLESRERLAFLQEILKRNNEKYEPISSVDDESEMQKFIDLEIFYDFEEIQEEFDEFGNFYVLVRMLLHNSKLLEVDGEVFDERFTIGEVVDIYPSIWRRALELINIELPKDELQVTINGEKPQNDEPFEDDTTIEVSFKYKDVDHKYKYVRDEIFKSMLDESIIAHIEEFLDSNEIDLHLLKVNDDGCDEYYILSSASVEELDKYK